MNKLNFALIIFAAALAGCGDKDDTAADTAVGETETDTAAEDTAAETL
jgi:hypothetical protein